MIRIRWNDDGWHCMSGFDQSTIIRSYADMVKYIHQYISRVEKWAHPDVSQPVSHVSSPIKFPYFGSVQSKIDLECLILLMQKLTIKWVQLRPWQIVLHLRYQCHQTEYLVWLWSWDNLWIWERLSLMTKHWAIRYPLMIHYHLMNRGWWKWWSTCCSWLCCGSTLSVCACV